MASSAQLTKLDRALAFIAQPPLWNVYNAWNSAQSRKHCVDPQLSSSATMNRAGDKFWTSLEITILRMLGMTGHDF